MVARRKAITSTARVAAQRAFQQPVSDGDDDPVARELVRLQAMRADALAWVAELERRIGEIEHVVFKPEDIDE